MDVAQRAEALAGRMSAQLRVKGEGLADVAARAGRRLPRHLRAEVAAIVEAEAMSENPKLARLIDEKRIRSAERKVRKYLDRQNPGAERRAAFLDRLAAVAFVFVVVVLGVFFWALSQGYFE